MWRFLFCILFYVVMWTTEIVFADARSLSLSSLLLCLQK